MKNTTLLLLFALALGRNSNAQSPITDFKTKFLLDWCDYKYAEFTYVGGNFYDTDSLLWEYGDGKIAHNSTVSGQKHEYSVAGKYTVSLTIWKDGIETKIVKPDLIVIFNAPNPDFSFSSSDSLMRAPVTLNMEASLIPGDTDIISFQWEIWYPNSIVFSTDTNPEIIFDKPGNNKIILWANDGNGCIRSHSEYLYVIDSIQVNQFHYIVEECNDNTSSSFAEKHYLIENDSLKISGKIRRNCCGDNTAVIQWKNDTLFIPTFKKDDNCDCTCLYNFEINVPQMTNDSVLVVFDEEIVLATKEEYCVGRLGFTRITACNSYTSPSGRHTWNTSGRYNDTLTSTSGCDSIFTISLTIPIVDTSLTISEDTLKAHATNATFRWINCATNTVLSGKTSASFLPAASGNYAVEVHQNDCIDTSACYEIIVSPDYINDIKNLNLQAYPIPTSGKLEIEFLETEKDILVILLDITGQVLKTNTFTNQNHIVIDIEETAGIYLVEVILDNNRKHTIQVIKQ